MVTDLSRLDFNPYHKWLGIPAEACPPNHYRLLGLELFEDDPEVIATAADRQMAHVKSFSTGSFARASQELLNQLSQARICLLNEQRKQLYDSELRERTASSVSPVVTPPEIGGAEGVAFSNAVLVEGVPVRPVKRRRRRRQSVFAPLLLMVAGMGAVGGLLYYAATQAPVARQEHNPQEAPAREIATDTVAESSPRPEDNLPSRPFEGDRDPPADTEEAIESQTPRVPNRGFPSRPETAPELSWPSAFDEESDAHDPASDLPDAAPGPRALDALPIHVTLPDAGQSDAIEIVTFAGPHAPSALDLQLVVADYIARGPRQIFLQAAEAGEWLVFDESPDVRRQLAGGDAVDNATPFGRLSFNEGRLLFQWMNDPTYRDQGKRLKHCLLQLRIGSEERVIQLRVPAGNSEPIDIGRLDKEYVHVIETGSLEPLPPTGSLHLALTMLPGFPATRPLEGDPDRIPAETQLDLRFTQLRYAGVGAYWQRKGRRLSITILPGFRLRSSPDDIMVLSMSQISRTQDNLQAHAQQVERGRGKRNNSDSLSDLDDLGRKIKLDLDQRIPDLKALALELEGSALVGFELYVPAGDHRVILYRQGIDGSSRL